MLWSGTVCGLLRQYIASPLRLFPAPTRDSHHAPGRYLSTPLFADIEADMNEAELEVRAIARNPGAHPTLAAPLCLPRRLLMPLSVRSVPRRQIAN